MSIHDRRCDNARGEESPGPLRVTRVTTHRVVTGLAHSPGYGAATRASRCAVARVTRLMRE